MVRVVVADDEVLLREGTAAVLSAAGFQVVATARDADQLVDVACRERPDLVVADIRMPPMHRDDGLQAALKIQKELPATAVVLLSQYLQRGYAMQLLANTNAGVGYLLKQRIADVDRFCTDLREVCGGATVLDPEVAERLVERACGAGGGVARLTPRQQAVLRFVAEGRSNSSIADLMGISEKAVVAHTSNIYLELGLPPDEGHHRRVLAVLQYLAGDRATSVED